MADETKETEVTTETPEVKDEKPDKTEEKDAISKDEQIQALMAENAKLKREKDTASTDAAKWKKQYNSTLTDAQKAAQEKAEKDAAMEEELKELRKKDRVNELTTSYLDMGFTKDKAKEAASALYEGDMETFNRLLNEHQAEHDREKEQEWLKSRPQVNTGTGDGEEDDPFLKGFNSVGTLARR